jgi:arylsulfatase A-like enzyme
MGPNVLLVVLDAARRDALEPYGAPPGSTPALRQLAARGTALEGVYATGCWTVPSHSSLFTGLLPRAAGLAQGGSPEVVRPVVERHRERMLAEVLRRAGYRTAGVSANLWVSEASGLGAGFEEFVQIDTGRHEQLHTEGVRGRLRWDVEAVRGRVDDGAAAALRAIERLAAQPAQGPFLWFVNLMECHAPYLPPRPYGGAGALRRLRVAEDARRHYTMDGIWGACAGTTPVPAATLDRMRPMYAAAIRYMDDWLARVLELMDAASLLDDTLVIVTSDHGENLGEAGLISHAASLDNRLIHVPLVVAGPGAETASIASLADLPRLVADAVGLDEHPWHDGPPPGVGIAQFDPPAAPDDAEAMRSIQGLPAPLQAMMTTPLTCAVAGGLKLLRRGEREELFDLAADPLELRPLDPAVADGPRAGAVAALREALDHPAAAYRAAVAASPHPGGDAEVRELEDRMRLLGYL